MSDVPRSPSRSFPTRYANELRIHNYLRSNPINIQSWTADISRSHMQLSDSVESFSTKSSSSSSSQPSSSSSGAKRIPPSSPTLLRHSLTSFRRTSLYSAARTNSPSPILNIHSSSSSYTAAPSAPPTLPVNNHNNNEQIMPDINDDLAAFSCSRVENSNPRFSTPTKRK